MINVEPIDNTYHPKGAAKPSNFSAITPRQKNTALNHTKYFCVFKSS